MPAGLSVAQINISVTADTSDADGKLAATGEKVESFASKTNQATSSTKDFTAASGLMATGAVGIAAGLAASAMAAGDFQASINEIGVVTGATADELQGLSDLALKIGKDTAFSAQEGAAAITELGKAGIGITDIMSGAAEATAALAGAGGVDMARAAQVMSAAMNIFQIEGSKSAEVADILAAGANASASSVDDLANGFSNAGPAAAALGMDLDDTVAVLALLADRGLSGAEAGTQLRGVLTSLTPKTKPAVEAFAELGLAVGESGNAFFDASGKFVGMEQASATLYDALKDLTDIQRAQALETIFGTYNAGAAETMFQAQKAAVEGTGKGYADYNKEVQAAGQATDVANAKMDGMNGAIMALQGSIETAQIVIGMQFVGAIEAAAEFLATLVNAFLALPEPVQTAIAGVAAGAAAFLAVGSAVGFIIGPLGAFVAALAPLAAGIVAIAAPLALVVAGIAALYVAYQTNFLGFADGVNAAVAGIQSAFQQITAGITALVSNFQSLVASGMNPLAAAVAALSGAFPALSGAISTAGALIQTFLTTVQGVAAGLMSAFDALRNGDLSGVFQGLLAAGQAAVTGLLNHFSILGGGILQAFNAINWSAISATLQAGLQSASTALQQWFGTISQNLQTWFTSIDWGVIGGMLSTGLQTAIAAMGDVASLLLTKGAELISGLSAGFAQAWPTVSAWLSTVPTLIGAAIAGAGSLAQILVTKGAELISGLSAGFAQAWPTVAAWLGTVPGLIGAAIAGAGSLAQILVTKGAELISGLSAGFAQAWPTVSAWLTTVPVLIGAAMGAAGDVGILLLQKGVEVITGLLTGLQQKWPEIETWLGTVKDLMGTAVGDLTQTLLAKGSDLLAGLKSGIDQKWPEVDAWLAALPQDITDTVGDFATTLQTKGGELMTGLKAGIDEKWPEIDSWLSALPQDAADTVGDLSQTLVDKGTELLTGLKQGIDDKWPEVETWLGTVKDLASTAVGDLTESIKAHGTELITGLSTGAQDFWTGTVEPWLGTIADMASTAVGDLAQTLVEKGTALIEGMRHGAQDFWNNTLGPWLQSLPGLIVSAVGDLSQTLVNAGASVMGGLISGIQSKVGDLQAKLGEVTSLIPISKGPPTKDAVLLFKNGQLIMQGLIEGIASRMPDLKDLLQSITETIQSRFDDTRPYNESGKKAGKNVVDGMNEAAGDISDYEVGSAEWRQALQNKITAGMDKVGKKVGDDLNLGVKSKKADHQKAMGEFLDAGVDYGLTKADDAEDIGVKAANAMRQGLTNGQQDLVTTAGKIATQVINEFGAHVQDMYDIGKNYMEGFALGMRAGAGDVESAANDIGKSAEKELRKATESQSPSKAAFRVGEDVGRGFADGISSTEDLSRKAARKLWRAAWKELKDNIKEAGFLGADWAVDFWQGMLNSPDMTGPLAAWITDQMVAAADTALKKIQAQIAGLAAQLDIARGLVGAPSAIPEVPQPAAVDTSQKDMLQQQLDATRDLTDAITKAFESAFSEAHKAHVAFVKGSISESEYLSKYQAAQDAFNAKNANERQAAALEAQVTAAQAAIDAETAARKKAYDEAVKARDAAIAAEDAARRAAVAQLEQAQRDAQMEMTRTVIDEANQRISQYEKEMRKANDPKQRAELKAKIALERERIDVANQLAAAITAANTATSDFDLAQANAQIAYFTAQLDALGQVDVGGMLQGIADAMLEAANKIAQAADKMKHAFGGGGGGSKKDKLGGTQDASDPSLSGGGGGGMDSVVQQFDKGGKAARKFGEDTSAGMGVADVAIRKVLGSTLPEFTKGMGDAGTKGGKALGDNASIAIEHGEATMSKTIVTSVEKGTVNGIKMGADRGKEIGVTITTNMETGARERTREVTKTLDGVVTSSTKAAEKPAKTGGQAVGDQFIYYTAQAVRKGEGDVRRAGKTIMDGAGAAAKQDANRLGKAAGDDLGRGVADGIRGRKGDVERAARELADAADKASRKKSESRSPSRVWMRHGWDMGDGMVIGLEDKLGAVEKASEALVYTPRGLPVGDDLGPRSGRSGGKGSGGNTTVNINGPVNLPNVHNPEEFIAWVENVMRTTGVSSGRG